MTDIDDRLQKAAQQFKSRDVSSDFTARVLAQIEANPKRAPKKGVFMNFLQKPVVVAVAIAVVLLSGSTTYAATAGFTKPFDLKNIFGYQELRDNNGARIIQVKTSDCDATPGAVAESDRNMYYRVKDDKAVDTKQVLRWVQGSCEQYQYSLKHGDLLESLADYDPANHSGAEAPDYTSNLMRDWGLLGVVPEDKAVSISWIDSPSNAQNANTYGVVASNVLIRNWKDQDLKYADLKTGRFAGLVVRLADQADKVVYIYQASSDETFYMKNKTISKNIERVLPCKSDRSGYCTTKQSVDRESSRNADDSQSKTQPQTENNGTITQTDEAVAFVEQAYGWYQTTMPGGDYNATKQSFGSRYTTPELAQSLMREAPYDTIMCVQQAPGSGQWYSFTEPQLDGNLVSVIVRANATDVVEARDLAEVTYDVRKGKIASIDCMAGM